MLANGGTCNDTTVRMTEHGLGVFAAADIKSGTLVERVPYRLALNEAVARRWSAVAPVIEYAYTNSSISKLAIPLVWACTMFTCQNRAAMMGCQIRFFCFVQARGGARSCRLL